METEKEYFNIKVDRESVLSYKSIVYNADMLAKLTRSSGMINK